MKSWQYTKLWIALGVVFGLAHCGFDDGQREPITPQDEYTKQEPGMWAGKEEGHLPIVTVERLGREKVKVSIKIHDPRGFDRNHYIEKIGIFDNNKVDIAIREYSPADFLPGEPMVAEFQVMIPDESPKIKAFVKCNLHDLWTAPLFPED